MADVSRRDFIKTGLAGAALLTYVTPTIETFMMADAWADSDRGGDDSDRGGWEGHDRGRRHPSKKKMGKGLFERERDKDWGDKDRDRD